MAPNVLTNSEAKAGGARQQARRVLSCNGMPVANPRAHARDVLQATRLSTDRDVPLKGMRSAIPSPTQRRRSILCYGTDTDTERELEQPLAHGRAARPAPTTPDSARDATLVRWRAPNQNETELPTGGAHASLNQCTEPSRMAKNTPPSRAA